MSKLRNCRNNSLLNKGIIVQVRALKPMRKKNFNRPLQSYPKGRIYLDEPYTAYIKCDKICEIHRITNTLTYVLLALYLLVLIMLILLIHKTGNNFEHCTCDYHPFSDIYSNLNSNKLLINNNISKITYNDTFAENNIVKFMYTKSNSTNTQDNYDTCAILSKIKDSCLKEVMKGNEVTTSTVLELNAEIANNKKAYLNLIEDLDYIIKKS